MKINRFNVIVGIVLMLALGMAGWTLFGRLPRQAGGQPSGATLHAKAQLIREARQNRWKKSNRRGIEDMLVVRREKPRLLELEDDEEAKLTEYSKRILRELQAALDAEDFKSVSRLVCKMQEIPPDPLFGKEGVAAILRRKAIEALGWFGATALPELSGMLADPDPEIVQATLDQFQLALEDVTLSDYERADIISMAAKVLKDTDGLEMIFMEINNMRHSVGAGLLVDVCLNGTEEAKGLMKDAIEFFTGEDDLSTVEDVERWLSENPDGEDDDDLYGGMEIE